MPAGGDGWRVLWAWCCLVRSPLVCARAQALHRAHPLPAHLPPGQAHPHAPPAAPHQERGLLAGLHGAAGEGAGGQVRAMECTAGIRADVCVCVCARARACVCARVYLLLLLSAAAHFYVSSLWGAGGPAVWDRPPALQRAHVGDGKGGAEGGTRRPLKRATPAFSSAAASFGFGVKPVALSLSPSFCLFPSSLPLLLHFLLLVLARFHGVQLVTRHTCMLNWNVQKNEIINTTFLFAKHSKLSCQPPATALSRVAAGPAAKPEAGGWCSEAGRLRRESRPRPPARPSPGPVPHPAGGTAAQPHQPLQANPSGSAGEGKAAQRAASLLATAACLELRLELLLGIAGRLPGAVRHLLGPGRHPPQRALQALACPGAATRHVSERAAALCLRLYVCIMRGGTSSGQGRQML